MTFPLLPTMVVDSVTDLSAQMLRQRQIQLLMLDFDNTIVPYTTDVPTEEMLLWLQTMLASDIRLCVVSNSRNARVRVFCQTYGLDCITHAKKPFPKGIRRCLDQYGLQPSQCALAGDQIYTDILGANCCGVQSVLVRAIHNHTIWLKLRHVAELPFRAAAKNRRVSKHEKC